MGDEKTSRRNLFLLPNSMIFLWFLLWAIWLVANASFSADVIITGGVISLPIAFIFAARGATWQNIAPTPKGIYHFVVYTGVFFRELVVANINVMRWVYAPRINIRPGVVRINTRLTSPIGRLALANSIALTPGSLVLDIEGDTLLIHWLDVQTLDREEATQAIAGPYEKHLEKVFG
ncbi:MAG: Na+/H+ antiporter subunit E [Phyllobacterium sp.]